jgi:Alkyl sulfatase and related hydrolases
VGVVSAQEVDRDWRLHHLEFSECGQPAKVQRYAADWARALRRMVAMGPELLLPAHGLPIVGKERIAMVLGEIASALESLVTQVIQMMNDGATLDAIIHTVQVPAAVLAKPIFATVVRRTRICGTRHLAAVRRLVGRRCITLEAAPDAVLGTEIAALAGGPTC